MSCGSLINQYNQSGRSLELGASRRCVGAYQIMNGLIIAKARARVISLLLVFALCQVIGTMCAMPDQSLAEGVPHLAEEMSHAACPMNGTIMCPPSLTSSPERQLPISTVTDVDTAQTLVNGATTPASPPAKPMRSVSSAYSIVPISIAASPVLRI